MYQWVRSTPDQRDFKIIVNLIAPKNYFLLYRPLEGPHSILIHQIVEENVAGTYFLYKRFAWGWQKWQIPKFLLDFFQSYHSITVHFGCSLKTDYLNALKTLIKEVRALLNSK